MNKSEYQSWCLRWGFKPGVVNVAGKEVPFGKTTEETTKAVCAVLLESWAKYQPKVRP